MIPLALDQLLNSFMGTVDTLIVSNIGSAAISAVSLVDAINILIVEAFFALAAGGTVICSQYLGSKDVEKANEAAGQLVFVTFFLSLIMAVVCIIFHEPVLQLIFKKNKKIPSAKCRRDWRNYVTVQLGLLQQFSKHHDLIDIAFHFDFTFRESNLRNHFTTQDLFQIRQRTRYAGITVNILIRHHRKNTIQDLNVKYTRNLTGEIKLNRYLTLRSSDICLTKLVIDFANQLINGHWNRPLVVFVILLYFFFRKMQVHFDEKTEKTHKNFI